MMATAPFENHNVRMGSEQQPPIPAQSIHFVKMAADVSKSTSSLVDIVPHRYGCIL